jgi:acetyltransferase EpsM
VNLLIYGAGGHAKVVADVALESHVYKSITFLDPKNNGFDFINKNNIFHLSSEADLPGSKQLQHSIIAVGDNQLRKKITLEHTKDTYVSICSSQASISQFSTVSIGTFISAGAIVNADSFIGAHSIVNTQAVVEHDCKVGDFCHIGPNATLAGGVSLGDNVFIGGAAYINPNISICHDVVIGSGAVVIDNISEPGVYVGVPCKKLDNL